MDSAFVFFDNGDHHYDLNYDSHRKLYTLRTVAFNMSCIALVILLLQHFAAGQYEVTRFEIDQSIQAQPPLHADEEKQQEIKSVNSVTFER